MNTIEILRAYKAVGIQRKHFTEEQTMLIEARSQAQAAIRKVGCSILINDDGIEIIGGRENKAWFVSEVDLDVAYQTAIEKISTGKGTK